MTSESIVICDRCGLRITGHHLDTTFYNVGHLRLTKSFDFCPSCQRDIVNWLKKISEKELP